LLRASSKVAGSIELSVDGAKTHELSFSSDSSGVLSFPDIADQLTPGPHSVKYIKNKR